MCIQNYMNKLVSLEAGYFDMIKEDLEWHEDIART
jgi:hypothetical protein